MPQGMHGTFGAQKTRHVTFSDHMILTFRSLSKHQVLGETNSGTLENAGVEPTILGCSMVLLFHPTACDEQTSVDASRKQEGELTVVWARMNNSISKKHMHQIAAELIICPCYILSSKLTTVIFST
jgi:hypothetical protein